MTVGKEYTQRDLAKDYWAYASAYCTGIDGKRERSCRRQQAIIASTCTDMIGYFSKHGSFDDLKVDGLTDRAKEICGWVLKSKKLLQNRRR